jgi:acyl-CoA synthetase (AMP-forming)/AMP-acid ligase II
MRRETLLDFFDDFASLRGVFLAHDNGFRRREHTYADVARASRAFAARLDAAGVRKGDTVVFWSENRPEWIAALWACLLQGAIVVPSTTAHRPTSCGALPRSSNRGWC